MGRRGPPPLPSAIKRARGTYQSCRESPSEPRGTRGVPDMPPGLDDRERAEWQDLGARLLAMGVLHKQQLEAFELLVRAKCRFIALAERVREMGEVLTDANGDLYRNPVVVSAERAAVEYRRLLLEFGLTPSSATRVHADGERVGAEDATARRFFGLVNGGLRRRRSP